VAGSIGITTAMFIFHILFIDTPPNGFLIPLGCTLIAFAFALGGLIRFRWVAMLLSIGAVFLAITGTWWIHATRAASITELTPLFFYDYNWSPSQILFTSMMMALWMSIFGNLVQLGVGKKTSS
jgi:hypothetical protein